VRVVGVRGLSLKTIIAPATLWKNLAR